MADDPWASFRIPSPQAARPVPATDPWAEFRAAPAAAAPAQETPAAPGGALPSYQKLTAVMTGAGRLLGQLSPFAGAAGPASHLVSPPEPKAVQELSALGQEVHKGVPILGGRAYQTPEMTQFEQEHPGLTLGARVTGGIMGLAPGAAAAPVAFGIRAPQALAALPRAAQYLGRLGIGSATAGGVAGADQAVREAVAPQTGQEVLPGNAIMQALGMPSTGLSPVDAAITGAALNAAATPALSGAAAVLSPPIKATARMLANAGVRLSPGQMFGGWAKTTEELGAALPYSGLNKVTREAMPSFNRAAENMALEQGNIPEFRGHLATEVPHDVESGFQGRQFVHNQVGRAFDIALEGAPGETPPQVLFNQRQTIMDLAQIWRNMPDIKEETVGRLGDILDRQVFSRMTPVWGAQAYNPATGLGGGLHVMDGRGASNAMKELKDTATRAMKKGGDDYDLGDALMQTRDYIMNHMIAQNPVAQARLEAAKAMHAHYAELRAAGARTGAGGMEGQFTPEQLAQGASSADISIKKAATSEGRTLYGGFARAGKDVGISEPKEIPTMAKLEALGIMGGASYINPWLAGAYPAGWVYASGPVQAALRGWFQRVGPQLGNAAPPLARALAMPPSADAVLRALGKQQQ